jgi:threonine synthase
VRMPILGLVACLMAACQSAAKYADQHTFGPMLGPCAESMDSVEKARGEPWKKVVGDEEDVQTGRQLFEHEWGYRLEPPSADSVQVVRFRWESDKPGCLVDTRRARLTKGGLLLPWEEAPE